MLKSIKYDPFALYVSDSYVSLKLIWTTFIMFLCCFTLELYLSLKIVLLCSVGLFLNSTFLFPQRNCISVKATHGFTDCLYIGLTLSSGKEKHLRRTLCSWPCADSSSLNIPRVPLAAVNRLAFHHR